MEKTKLTIRVSRDLIEGAKRYASENDTTLTRLISEYLRQLATQSDPLANAPIVERLSGTLSQDVSIDDYRKYLEEKYGWIEHDSIAGFVDHCSARRLLAHTLPLFLDQARNSSSGNSCQVISMP